MKKLALAVSILVWMCGCAGPGPSKVIEVTVSPAMPPNIDQGQTLQFTATTADTASTAGVSWSVSGNGCSGAACGIFTSVTTTSATYQAPATVSAPLTVTITATSVAQSTQIGSAFFAVNPPPSIVTTSLPKATPGYTYSYTLSATGGTQPLLWSVANGSLPEGLTLSNTGVIYGQPTSGEVSTFTLKVTDSSPAPQGKLSAQQQFSMTVVGVLSVPSANLPAGILGTGYTTSISATGGLPPLTWRIYTGSLPPGLVMQQSTGVISGTPTLVGTYNFDVKVVDSSPVQQYFISSNFSITINASGPLTIRTTSMLDATAGVDYQGQVAVTGGAPPIAWSIISGSLPPGLTLSPTTGVISGIPTGAPGTSAFTVQVQDTSTPPETSIQALSLTVSAASAACPSTGNNSVLLGQYAFNLKGFNGTGFLAVVGSFTADGNGNITGGEADTNGVLGAQNGSLITSASSYSVGPDNRGCATLATPFGTLTTRFALGAISAGVATAGRIIEFDPPGSSAFVASGQVFQQSAASFISPLTGSFDLRTTGWDWSTSARLACVGIVTANKFAFSYLQQDCNDGGTVTNTTSVFIPNGTTLNTYGPADTNGRGTGIILAGQNASDFTFYWVSPTELFIINSDFTTAFSGYWQLEEVPLGSSGFNQGAFLGSVAAYATGIGQSGAGGDASFTSETSDGASSVTADVYRDIGGTWENSTPTCTYAVVSIGRMTETGSNCYASPPITYLNTTNTAFVLGTDTGIELGVFEPQTANLSTAAIAGTYYLGTSEITSQSAQAEVGILTLTDNGIITTTTDTSSAASQNSAVAGSDTLSLNADGTFTLGSSGTTTVGIAISGSRFVMVGNSTTYPTLLVTQQ